MLLTDSGITLLDTSFLYETAPMYVVNQPKFYNAVIKCQTSLSPIDLLGSLQAIENNLGRNRDVERNGPRLIDLDILFYDDLIFNNSLLIIPHPRISERAFVLIPLCE